MPAMVIHSAILYPSKIRLKLAESISPPARAFDLAKKLLEILFMKKKGRAPSPVAKAVIIA